MRLSIVALSVVAVCSAATDVRLIDAVKDQNRKLVSSLIAEHADVNALQPDGATPLAWAVYLDQPDVVDALMKAGAKVNTSDQYGETPLTLACVTGDFPVIEKLVSAGADVNAARWNGETALMIASRTGSIPAVKLLLAKGAKVNAGDAQKNQTALMWAAAEGHSDVVSLLIQNGADIKAASKAGFTASLFAIQKGDAASVISLLEAGADANYTLPSGMTALQLAVAGGKSKPAEALMDKGANVKVADKTGNTPLHIASQAGNVELVKYLLAKGADPNAQTAKIAAAGGRGGGGGGGFFRNITGEQTPLLLAAKADKVDVMKALKEAGANPELKAQDGTTLMMAAAGSGHLDAVEYAYSLSPDVKSANARKSTVMHAVVQGTLGPSTQAEICKVIQFLADKGAALDPEDARGQTPIVIADVIPIDKAAALLAKLILASGGTPKVSPSSMVGPVGFEPTTNGL